jgi:hypothetical protein
MRFPAPSTPKGSEGGRQLDGERWAGTPFVLRREGAQLPSQDGRPLLLPGSGE